LLGLLLGADEQHVAALGDRVAQEAVGGLDGGAGLLQVDDVDAVALTVDEALHLRVPAPGLVPEVDASFEQLAHSDDCHGGPPCRSGSASARCAPTVVGSWGGRVLDPLGATRSGHRRVPATGVRSSTS